MNLLHESGFFAFTGVLPENVYFVDEYEDKGVIGRLLGINYILDDSVRVAKIARQNGIQCILFGYHDDFHI